MSVISAITSKQKETILENIRDYYEREFDETEIPTDMSKIDLAYTTLTDMEIPIEVSLNLEAMELTTKIGDHIEKEPVSANELMNGFFFDFDNLTAWSNFIEEHPSMFANWGEEHKPEPLLTATELCNFFEFTIQREDGVTPDGEEYKYRGFDQQGTFEDRYAEKIEDIPEWFDGLIDDYIINDIKEYGFVPPRNRNLIEAAIEWMEECPDFKDTISLAVCKCMQDPRLIEDNVKTEEQLELAEQRTEFDIIGQAAEMAQTDEFIAADHMLANAVEHGFSVQEINKWLNSNWIRGLYEFTKDNGLLAPNARVLSEHPDIDIPDVQRDMQYIRDGWEEAIETSVTVPDIIWDTSQDDGTEPKQEDLGLPDKVAIMKDEFTPENIKEMAGYDYECVSNYLSNKYGFCVRAFETEHLDDMVYDLTHDKKKGLSVNIEH